jgi:NTE family protein
MDVLDRRHARSQRLAFREREGLTRRVETMTDGAVVFAGGGLAGIAWETGVLRGIQETEPKAYEAIVDASTTFVGTSAGSAVAAQVAGGTPLSELFDAQLSEETTEIGANVDLEEFMAAMTSAVADADSPDEMRRRIGRVALEAKTVPAADRLAAIDARLPVKSWPDRRLLIGAVDAESGEFRVFDRDSGVGLVDAVAASCAVPGIWPTVLIDGHKYMDGGMRTLANADLATGADRVLLLVPAPADAPAQFAVTEGELGALAPARIHLLYADAASVAAFGSNPLDPSVRKPAALAGLDLGRRVAAEVAAFWG